MNIIYSRSWHIVGRRVEHGGVETETSFCDDFVEKTLHISANAGDFLIKSAEIETHSGLNVEENNTILYLDRMVGEQAWFGSGKAVKETTKTDTAGYNFEILLEGIEGVIQTDSFFVKEKGFNSDDEYDDFWETEFKNTCAYYSNLHLYQERFMEIQNRLKFTLRQNKIFNRMRTCLLLTNHDYYMFIANMIDTFHNMKVIIEFDNTSLKVQDIHAQMVNTPDNPICMLSLDTVNRLNGTEININSWRKVVANAIGGKDGCSHLAAMITEAARCFKLSGILK